MECPRCKGRMVRDTFIIPSENGLPSSYVGWRCLHCGEVIDMLILINRRLQKNKGKKVKVA